MMPPHIIAMRAKKVTLNKRLTGFARMLFPARTVRTIGTRMTMNAIGKSHNRPNNTSKAGGILLGYCVIQGFEDRERQHEDKANEGR